MTCGSNCRIDDVADRLSEPRMHSKSGGLLICHVPNLKCISYLAIFEQQLKDHTAVSSRIFARKSIRKSLRTTQFSAFQMSSLISFIVLRCFVVRFKCRHSASSRVVEYTYIWCHCSPCRRHRCCLQLAYNATRVRRHHWQSPYRYLDLGIQSAHKASPN